jgi:tetratricopeptide (TPR) repeat protein
MQIMQDYKIVLFEAKINHESVVRIPGAWPDTGYRNTCRNPERFCIAVRFGFLSVSFKLYQPYFQHNTLNILPLQKSFTFLSILLLTGFFGFLGAPAAAQLVTRYAILLDGEGSKSSRESFENLTHSLEQNGFLRSDIIRINASDIPAPFALAEIKKISRRAEPGDLVYLHLRGQFRRRSSNNATEKDGMEEIFTRTETGKSGLEADEIEVLRDEQLAGALRLLREKVGKDGCLVLGFDPTEIIPFQNPGSSRKEQEYLDFLNQEPGDESSRLVWMGLTGKSYQTDGPNNLCNWLSAVLQAEKKYDLFKALKKSTMLQLPSESVNLSGNLDEPFFHARPVERRWRPSQVISQETHLNKAGQIHAMAIGVSEYQGRFSPLHYAHSDALSFYNLLRAGYGTRFKQDTSLLFLNDRASSPRIYAGLNKLNAEIKKGDVLYFFFAGHGDVEGDLINRPEYLLLKNGPEMAYGAGGHLPASDLENYFLNFLYKGCRVVIVVDACRSGGIGRSLEAASNGGFLKFSKVNREVVRILSAHPNQSALEGSQFGGGFGAFTYYLLQAAGGEANRDKNDVLSLGELRQYMEKALPEATVQKQNPMIEGPAAAEVFPVVPDIRPGDYKTPRFINLLEARQEKAREKQNSSQVSRTEMLLYRAISQKNLLQPDTLSALHHVKNLKAMVSNETFRQQGWALDFAGAAYENSQNLINDYVAGKESMAEDVHFARAANELEAALAFLYANDDIYFPVMARYYFLKARSISEAKISNDLDRKEADKAIENLRFSIRLEPNSPHAHNAMGRLFLVKKEFDSARIHFSQALRLTPDWSFAMNNIGNVWRDIALFSSQKKFLDSAEVYFKKTLSIDGNFYRAVWNLANTHADKGNKAAAKSGYFHCTRLNPQNPRAWRKLIELFRVEENWDSAFAVLKISQKMAEEDADLESEQGNLLYEYGTKHRHKPARKDSLLKVALEHYRNANRLLPHYDAAILGISNVFWELKNYDSSAHYAGELLLLDSMDLDYARYQFEALVAGKKWSRAEQLLNRIGGRFATRGEYWIMHGLLFQNQQNIRKMMGSFLKASVFGAKMEDFETFDQWASVKKEKWYPEWKRMFSQ